MQDGFSHAIVIVSGVLLLSFFCCLPDSLALAASQGPTESKEIVAGKDHAVVNPPSRSSRPAPKMMKVEVVRQIAENLAAAVFTYAEALKDIHQKALAKIPILKKQNQLNSREEQFLRSAKYLKSVYDLGLAIEQDIHSSAKGPLVRLRSHTLEAIGKFGLKTLIFHWKYLDQKFTLDKRISGMVERIEGFQQIATGLAKHIGSGKADIEVITHYVDGIKELAKVQLEGRIKMPGRLAFLDGIQDLAITGLQHHQTKRADIEVVTGYVDAINNLAWTGVGFTACAGHMACTAAVRHLGTTAAIVLRDSTAGFFKKGVLFFRRQDEKVVSQWLSTQQRNIQLGAPIQKISEVYGIDLLKQNGLSEKQIQQLDRSVENARAYAAHARQYPLPPVPSHYGKPFRNLGLIVDAARLSEAVYHDTFISFQGNGSGRWEQVHRDHLISGLEWSLYERRNAQGKRIWVLAFAGTNIRDLRDDLTDLGQLIIPPAQYREALTIAQQIIKQADKDPRLTLVLVGHSLGGGIAQYLSLHTGTRAIVFNSAPLGIGSTHSFWRDIDRAKIKLAEHNIINIYMRGEFVRNTPGTQLGRLIEIIPPPNNKLDLDPFKISDFDISEQLDRHSQALMVSALEHLQRSYHSILQANSGATHGQMQVAAPDRGGVDLGVSSIKERQTDLKELRDSILKSRLPQNSLSTTLP